MKTNNNAKLSWNDVRKIRSWHGFVPIRTLARRYQMSPAAISHIVNNICWYDPCYKNPVHKGDRHARGVRLYWDALTPEDRYLKASTASQARIDKSRHIDVDGFHFGCNICGTNCSKTMLCRDCKEALKC